MKGAFVAAVAAMAGAASAGSNHRHAHELFAKRGTAVPVPTGEMCIPTCTTIWKTMTGEPTLVPVPVTTVTATQTNTTTQTVTPAPTTTSTKVIEVVPTPDVETCPTPGTYTFSATTKTVTATTTVCGATSTKVPSGTHTYGGVTTVVETATTVTCPVATVETTGDVTTSTIRMTEYVCPSAGTYTINPTTTVCPEETVIVYPTPTTIVPGTYTRPETVVTVTETGFVTVCPYTSSGLPTTTPEPTPEPKPEPTPEPEPEPQPEPTTSVAPAPEPEKTKTPQKPSNNGGQGPTTDTDQLGITYTCYTSETGECKSAEQVKKDIADLAQHGFKNIRIYGTDCNTLESVTPACEENGVKIVTGIFIKPGGSCSAQNPDIKKQIDDLANWGRWDLVDLFVVGNEALMNGLCTASELATLVETVKSTCSSYTGLYTIAETLNIWQQSDVQSSICSVVDMVGANIHGFFNSQVAPSEAGPFVANQLDLLDNICDGKQAINLECGWPSQGNTNGLAIASSMAQIEAIKSIKQAAGSRTFLFSYENDFWKQPGSCNCEQSWGLMSALGL